METLSDKIKQAIGILDSAIEQWKPVTIYAGLSGGHDSIVSTHVAKQHLGAGCTVLHINTGIGIEKTRLYVRKACKYFGWDLLEKHATKFEFENFVLAHGFPGPPQHNRMYQRLKERVVAEVCREAKKDKHRWSKVMFITGVRAEESKRRAGYNRVVSKVGGQIWVNPIYRFTGNDKDAYMKTFLLPRNPVVDTLGMSGECLCGAYAHKGEKELIRLIEPETAVYLDQLEERVKASGMPWGWEEGPPKRWLLERRGQMNLFQPLCVGCEKVQRDSALKS